jgi:hypothetical protein
MTRERGKNVDYLRVEDGGAAGLPRTDADALEKATRDLFFAMRNKDGNAISKNFRNASNASTRPLRMLIRRFKEAKAARNDALNYPLMKQTVRAIDDWVDALHNKQSAILTTGEHQPPPAAPARRRAA